MLKLKYMQPQNPFQPQQNQSPQPPYQGPAGQYPPVAAPAPASDPYQQPAQNFGNPQQQPSPVQQSYATQSAFSAPGTEPLNNVNQYPVDYLNQIATPIPVKKLSPLLVLGLIGGILLITGLALFMLIKSTAPPDVGTQLYALQARLDTLNNITNATGKRLTQNNLSSINSTLGTTITSMQANLKTYMDARGYKNATGIAAAKKVEKSYADKLSQTLNDAYLTGTLDRSYSSEITYQLSILKSKLQKIKAAANSKSFTEFYDKNIPSLDMVSDQLAKFQNTK